MATSKIESNNGTYETLATGIVIQRFGRMRVLRLKTTYNYISTLTLPATDRPPEDIEFSGVHHAGGAYGALGIGYVRTTGKIECRYFQAYMGTAYSTPLVSTDGFIGEAIWQV